MNIIFILIIRVHSTPTNMNKSEDNRTKALQSTFNDFKKQLKNVSDTDVDDSPVFQQQVSSILNSMQQQTPVQTMSSNINAEGNSVNTPSTLTVSSASVRSSSEGDSKSIVDSILPATGTSNNSDLLTEEETKWLKEWPHFENPTQEDFKKWSKLARKEQRQRGGKTAGEMLRDIEDAKLKRCYGIRDLQRVDGGPYHYSKTINEILNKPDGPNLSETDKAIRKKALIFGSVVLLPSPTKYENERAAQDLWGNNEWLNKEKRKNEEEIRALQKRVKELEENEKKQVK